MAVTDDHRTSIAFNSILARISLEATNRFLETHRSPFNIHITISSSRGVPHGAGTWPPFSEATGTHSSLLDALPRPKKCRMISSVEVNEFAAVASAGVIEQFIIGGP